MTGPASKALNPDPEIRERQMATLEYQQAHNSLLGWNSMLRTAQLRDLCRKRARFLFGRRPAP